MRRFHRYLAMLLAVAMVLTMAPLQLRAYAEETVPVETAAEETVPEETFAEISGTIPVETAPVYDANITASGIWGAYNTDAITWMLYDDGTLEFTGTGAMYQNYSTPAWNSYDDSITKVIVNEGITSVSNKAFNQCTNLTEVYLPTSLSYIGEGTFAGCTGLRSIVIPEGTQRIGEEAFDGCANLSDISLPNTLTSIKNYAFWNCSSLTQIDLPESLTEIEYGAFSTCTALKSIEIPKGVTYLDSYLVRECANLETVELWYTLDMIDEDVFWKCPLLKTIIFHGTPAQWNAVSKDSTVTSVLNSQNVYIQYVDPCGNGHTEVTDPAVAATCTASGKTEGKHCSVCGEVLVAQEVIPAGHDFVDGVCQRCGIITGTCGENLTWILTEDGVLTISGTGKMPDYHIGVAPWYSYRDNIKTVVIEDGVTNIGDGAFYTCKNMTGVEISNSVTGIGDSAFQLCTALTDLVIPNSVTTIGWAAFAACYKLTDVVVPDSVTRIEESAFEGCKGLTSVTIGKSVSYICCTAFSRCTSLMEFNVSADNASYCVGEDGILFNKDKTYLVTYPAGKTGAYTVPDTVTEIGYDAFYDCKNLTSVTIPASVARIDECAFYDTGLTEVRFEGDAPELIRTYVGDSLWFGNYNGDTITVYYPADNATWTDEAKKSFNEDSLNWVAYEPYLAEGTCGDNLTWTLSEEGVLTISGEGEMAEYSATGYPWYSQRKNIKKVIIEDGVTSIGSYAFFQYTDMVSAEIGNDVTSIGEFAFRTCRNLLGVQFGNSVATIGERVFYGAGLTNVTLPASVTDIGPAAFCCTNLLEIWVEDGNTAYSHDENGILFNRDKTELVCVPGRNSGTYVIPNTVTHIGPAAFLGNSGLTGVTIPDSVTHIGNEAFHGCSNITDLTIGNSVTDIGVYAFYGCGELPGITIPDSVIAIGDSAFEDCGKMTAVTIGKSVKVIGDLAFDVCYLLKEITFRGDAPSFANESFRDLYATAYYPANNATWTEEVRQNYGGEVTWVADCSMGHAEVIDQAVEGDCTTPGKTEGKHCSACGEVLVAQEDVLGRHKFGEDGICLLCGVSGGDIGETLQWTLAEGVLTISGSGAMEDYATASNAPWYSKRTGIQKVIIGSGVTSIGDRAFYNCTGLTDVTIGDSVTTIGTYAFRGCTALESVTIPASVTEIEGSAFRASSALEEVIFQGNAPTVGNYVFNECAETLTVQCFEGKTSFDTTPWTGMNVVVNHVGQWIVDIEPTCTTDGSRHIDCAYCQKTITETITGGHNYVEGICTVCKDITLVDSGESYKWRWKLDVFGTLTISGNGDITGNPWRNNHADKILNIVIEEGITGIGGSAFDSCSNVTGVTIPESVTKIGSGAFHGCSSLESIVIPESVSEMGDTVFANCSSLKEIVIPDSVGSIGESVFYGCSSLTSAILPEGMETIGQYMFYGCSALTEITIADTVQSIGESAFFGCSSLKEIVIPDSVTEIGSSAFADCSGLTAVSIGNGVTKIGGYVFQNCTGLTNVVIPDSVNYIGEDVFSGCSGMESVTVPFVGAERNPADPADRFALGYIFGDDEFDGSIRITQYYYGNADGGMRGHTYYIPASLKSVTVTGGEIGYGAFSEFKNLTSVVLGEDINSIGIRAFQNCTGLTELTLPSGITTIETGTFQNCTSLTEIELPAGVTTIGKDAFNGCAGLTEILIPDTVAGIGDYAFSGCSSLKAFTIPKGVSRIGEYVFQDCSDLTGIEIPADVTEIGTYAFQNCTGLTEMVIPDNVTYIGEGALSGCSSLESLTIPFVGDSRKTAADADQYPFGYIFGTLDYEGSEGIYQSYCHDPVENTNWGSYYYIPVALKTVTVNGGEIPYCAFDGCTHLTDIVLADGITTIGSQAFQGCNALIAITIPDSVTSMGNSAFYCCSSLAEIHIPEGVTRIGDHALAGCSSLTSVTLPKTVTAIGGYAFWNSTALEEICFTGDAPEFEEYALWGVSTTAYYPGGNKTWTKDVMQSYGGITWKPYDCKNMHTEVIDEGVEATCTTDGLTEGKYCYFCGEILVEQEVIPAKGHGMKEIPAVKPTVDAEGNIAHFLCEVCGKLFADVEGAQELTAEDVILDKLVGRVLINGQYYMTAAEALAAAKPGDVVQLQQDVAEDTAIVPKGVVLDLNGFTLDADYFVSFNGAEIADNSESNTGLLKVDAERVMIGKNNAQLPVWNGEGYVFTTVTYKTRLMEHDNDKLKFAFLPQFKSGATALLEDGVDGNKVTIEVRVSWLTKMGREYRNLVFNEQQVDTVVGTNGAFILTFSGFSQLDMASGITVEGVVISETGVSIASEPIVVDVTKTDATE